MIVSASDRRRLEGIAADRNRPREHVERARVVPASAEDGSVQRVAAAVGVSRPTVWRWQRRYAEASVAGLLRDKTPPSHLDVRLIDVPAAPRLALAPAPQVLGQGGGELGLPLAHGLVAERDAARSRGVGIKRVGALPPAPFRVQAVRT